MASNAEIRTINFAQGVEVTLPDDVTPESSNFSLANNTADQDTGITLENDVVNGAVIEYEILRRTDSTTGLIEVGKIYLKVDPDGLTDADKWLMFHNKEQVDPGPGVTFSMDTSTPGEMTLEASTTNVAGANHSCVVSYKLTQFFA